ncbi:MAG: ABC transporter permease, partial [Marinilabiliaceae bacterium]
MFDIITEIFTTIRRNKMRTALTGFSVAWGIFILIVLLGAGNGLIHAFEMSSSECALNSIKVFPGWTSQAYDGLKAGRRIELGNNDLVLTKEAFPDNVDEVGAWLHQGGCVVSYGN